MTKHVSNLIIGAGAAGLAMGAHLSKNNLPYLILEQSSDVASSWRQRYDRLHLHTVKEFSALPYMPFPAHFPRYIPKDLLVQYYEKYVKTFALKINFNVGVSQVVRQAGNWLIEAHNGSTYSCDNVIICTGFNNKPYIPVVDGWHSASLRWMHASSYKNPQGLENKQVLVVGMGNSGAEIALDVSSVTAKAYLSVRGEVNIIKRDFLGNPIQKSAHVLGKLPHFVSDAIGLLMRNFMIGNVKRFGLKMPNLAPAKQLRLHGKTPMIDIGTVDAIKAGKIKVVPGLRHIQGNEVEFVNNQKVSFDMIIFATGYQSGLEMLVPEVKPYLNTNGNVSKWHLEALNGMYFLGFDIYANGLLQAIHADSYKILKHINIKE